MKISWTSSSKSAPIIPTWFEHVWLLDIPAARITSLLFSSMRIPMKTQLPGGSALVQPEAEYLVVVHTLLLSSGSLVFVAVKLRPYPIHYRAAVFSYLFETQQLLTFAKMTTMIRAPKVRKTLTWTLRD